MSVLGVFNTQIVNFANTLSERFPNDVELRMAKDAILLMKQANPRKNLELFRQYGYIYKEPILNKDENFIINTNFVSDLSIDNKEYAMGIMNKLKQYWGEIDDLEKSNIWSYLNVLIKLVDKIDGN